MKFSKIIGMTAALLIGVGTVATSYADGGKAKRDQHSGRSKKDADRRGANRAQMILSKDEVTKRYDKNGDGTLDYREKMGFIRSLNEEQRAAYRKQFSQVGQGRGDREAGKREHGDRKKQLSRRGKEGGPPAGMREMMQKRMAAAKGGRGQAGPPQHVIEMWKKRREAAQRGGRGPQARGGFKGFGGPRGPQARGGHDGPRGPKGRQARGGRGDHRGSKGSRARGGQRDHRGSKGRRSGRGERRGHRR